MNKSTYNTLNLKGLLTEKFKNENTIAGYLQDYNKASLSEKAYADFIIKMCKSNINTLNQLISLKAV